LQVFSSQIHIYLIAACQWVNIKILKEGMRYLFSYPLDYKNMLILGGKQYSMFTDC